MDRLYYNNRGKLAFLVIVMLLLPSDSFARGGKNYNYEPQWSLEQQFRKGLRERKKTTACRLVQRLDDICYYEGANNVKDTVAVHSRENCPRQIVCEY
jgi:hypothetical protein